MMAVILFLLAAASFFVSATGALAHDIPATWCMNVEPIYKDPNIPENGGIKSAMLAVRYVMTDVDADGDGVLDLDREKTIVKQIIFFEPKNPLEKLLAGIGIETRYAHPERPLSEVGLSCQ